MNDQQILTLIAATPGIRAAQLADKLNTPLVDVSASLRSLVDVGDVVKRTEFGENGRQWQAYDLSDMFRTSREGKQIAEKLGAPSSEAPKPEVDTLSKPVPSPFAQLEAEPAPAMAAGSKVDRAMACIRANGGAATDAQLREAMGLTAKASVSPYISGARHRGEIARDGALWKLGTSKGLLGSAVRVGNVIVATRDAAPVPPEVKAALTDVAAAAVTELRKSEPAPSAPTAAPPTKPAERAYRCAVWMSGNVEIRKGYGEIVLTQAELAEIMAFVAERRVA